LAVCQYFGQSGCTAPTFGGGSVPSVITPDNTPFPLNIFSFIFGSSPLEWILTSIVYLLMTRFIIWPLIVVPLLDYLNFRRQRRVNSVLLEMTPPRSAGKSAQSTIELFRVLHHLYSIQSFRDYWLRHKQLMSLEVMSSRHHGIRFLVRLPKANATGFKQVINSYLPEIKFQYANDYLNTPTNGTSKYLIEFRQLRSFIYPLRSQETLIRHDPIAYITGTMTKPKPGELLALQLVLSPYNSRRSVRLRNRIIQGKDPWLTKLTWQLPLTMAHLVLKITAFGLRIILIPLSLFFGGFNKVLQTKSPIIGQKIPYQPTLTAETQDIQKRMLNKLSEPLFYADLRAYLLVSQPEQADGRLKSLIGSLASFNDHGYQQLVARANLVPPFLDSLLALVLPKLSEKYHEYGLDKFKNRLPSLLRVNSAILSASEVASLYHFPYVESGRAENLAISLSRTLPASIDMKNHADKHDFDVVLGQNSYHGETTDLGLTAIERQRHVYIIGGTGNGKTTMLEYAIVQDMQKGKGIAVLDPHGDLAETLLRHIPENRIKDVIYLNPDDLAHPIGINLLEMTPGLTGDELLREKDLITEFTISVMRKIFSDDDSGGHRIEYVLRNTIQTALTLEGSTLFTIFRLLNDARYRRTVIKTLKDEDLKNFWTNELGKAGDFQRVKMIAGITAKIGRFLFSASAKKMLEQPKSTVDFDNLLNSGKILICNFSKGLLGEDTSTLFGTTILAKLQVAALRRARQPQTDRQPFYLYVDEFQNFATMSFVQMLSEARKYKLFLTMAEQSTAQQEYQRLVDVILANVGTVICFRSGSPADERYVLPLFRPNIEQGEIANLPAYNFYARIAAIDAQEPLSGCTILVHSQGSEEVAKKVIENSRQLYSVKAVINKLHVSAQNLTSVEPKSDQKQLVTEHDLE